MHGSTVYIDYTNAKGERRWRHIQPEEITFTSTKEHEKAQWILRAKDLTKDKPRSYAMANIHKWQVERPKGFK